MHQDRDLAYRVDLHQPLRFCHEGTVDYFIVNTLGIQTEYGPLCIGTEPATAACIVTPPYDISGLPHIDDC